MKKPKVLYNYLMVRLGIRDILPGEYIRKVTVEENNDELIEIKKSNNIIFSDKLKEPIYLRSEVYKKLKLIEKELKEKNYKLKIYDAYRTYKEQEESFERRYKETKEEFPNLRESEIIRKTTLKVSRITNKNNVGGHQTGGAIDITLTDKDGNELNMGTEYSQHNKKTKTHSKYLTKEEKDNRFYLVNLMKKYDFVNFPNEWWHYCYGDKMWAAYKFKKTCFYGYIEPKI